jgi:hypothetical protein
MTGTHAVQTSRLEMARSRGAITGPLLMLLGAWGALIPFFGHSFGFGYTPDNTWTWTVARGWLEVAPGAAAFLGGLLLTVSAHRVPAMFGGWLAAAGGAWLVLGTVVTPWWSAGNIGTPIGTTDQMVWERIGMFAGLGVVIVFLAAVALGRISVIGVRDVAVAEARQIDLTNARATTAPVATTAAPRGTATTGAVPAGATTTAAPTTTTTPATTTTEQPTSAVGRLRRRSTTTSDT